MNTERLHAIAKAVLDDLRTTKTESTLEQLVGSLRNQVNQPQAPQFQQQVSSHLGALNTQLAAAPSNSFSPTWKQALQELGLYDLLGEKLQGRIKEIFERNQITASIALEELQKLHAQLKSYSEALVKIVSSFELMKIGAEQLKPGQCEVGVLIPRLNHNRLDEFAEDLNDMNKIFGVFSELATGERPGFEIRSVSSSDFNVFLAMAPAIASGLVVAVDRIINIYKNILEIRKHQAGLKELGLSKKELKTIQEHADSRMKNEVEKIAKELIEKYKIKDPGRRNELEQELCHCLTKIAKRVDRGYSFEVKVQPLPEDEVATKKVKPDDIAHISTILSIGNRIEFLKLEGEPILSLPESQEDKKDKEQ